MEMPRTGAASAIMPQLMGTQSFCLPNFPLNVAFRKTEETTKKWDRVMRETCSSPTSPLVTSLRSLPGAGGEPPPAAEAPGSRHFLTP